MRGLNTAVAADPVRFLKIGIHAGPCIAVNANGKLDYFGTTINTASRVEHECRGGQIVLTDDALDDAAREFLAERGIVPEMTQVHLRGLSAPIALYRIAPEASASAPIAAA